LPKHWIPTRTLRDGVVNPSHELVAEKPSMREESKGSSLSFVKYSKGLTFDVIEHRAGIHQNSKGLTFHIQAIFKR
jgi:hypothetical protein